MSVEEFHGLLDSRTTRKIYFRGTERSRDPADTYSQLRGHLADVGITRVANITGLDRIGIPVFMVVRPNSRSLSVSQGKGVELDAARVSGIMEAIELYHAEYARCPVRIASYDELRDDAAVADPGRLPMRRDSWFAAGSPIPWAEGFDVLNREPMWVPFELVHANATLPRVPGSGCFVTSSNGLASGNTPSEAALHALCELIERDAEALWLGRSVEKQSETLIDLTSVRDSLNVTLLQRFARAEISILAWNITSDVGVPVVRVILHDRKTDPVLRPIAAAYGAGCHPNREVALARALTEAAQSRLTMIAGSRDDLTRQRYRSAQAADVLDRHRRSIEAAGRSHDFGSVPSVSFTTIEEDIRFVLTHLRDAGFARAVLVDLSRAGFPVSVVRAVVPGLEGPVDSPHYAPGLRSRGAVS